MKTNQQINESTNLSPKKWNWLEQRQKPAFLAMEDGTVLRGYSVGAARDNVGEIVFNTGLTGYQEILSDPSYAGQFVTMTYPQIGNTGINTEDMESRRFFVNGFIIHELNTPSNWRCRDSLSNTLVKWDIPAMAGIDTRVLTSKLRDQGTMKAYMAVAGQQKTENKRQSVTPKQWGNRGEGGRSEVEQITSAQGPMISEEEAVRKASDWEGLDNQDYAVRVSCKESYVWDEDGEFSTSWGIADDLQTADLKIVAYDFGIKWNILRSMRRSGIAVTVVPACTPAKEVLAMKPDGVFLSNGPADPAAVTYAINAARDLLGKIPIMGICLGHQILGIATGGRTERLKFGHHGCNHPVKDLKTSKIEITSQNHNFAIDADSLDSSKTEITHINLNDQTVEGIEHKKEPMFSVQYHPEACPGPHDPYYLFARFREMIEQA